MAVFDPCAPPGQDRIKGDPITVLQSRSAPCTGEQKVKCQDYNAVHVDVVAVGAAPSATLLIEGSYAEFGVYLVLADPQATQSITGSTSFDVVAGQWFVGARLSVVTSGAFTVTLTPYVSPGQPIVNANIICNNLAAINIYTGALTVSDVLTIGAAGSLVALGSGQAKLQIDATGIKTFNSVGTQTGQLLNDGSGWLGTSSVLSWTTAGVISLNGSAVMPGTITGGKVNFINVPVIDGLTLTSNSPGAGSIAWSTFTLTYQGTSYTVTAGNTASRFVWWNKATSTTVLQTGATPPVQAADQFIVAFNEGGTAIGSLFANIVYADYIAAATLAAIQANIGAAHIDGVLDVGAAGGIYQGTGTFASPTTGLKLWNASGVGKIAGYNAGVPQWYADTDGKLYSGAGSVVLDASGVSIVGQAKVVTWVDNGRHKNTILSRTPTGFLIENNSITLAQQLSTLFVGDAGLTVTIVDSLGSYAGQFLIDTTQILTDIAAYFGPLLAIGSAPAQSGILRIPNAQWIAARNAGNTADVNLIRVNASNVAELGVWLNTLFGIWTNDSLGVGANNAASGAIRLANNAWIAARNAANGGDVNLARVNASNQVEVGITWADWTPTVDQGGAVAATVTYARYALVGKVCHVAARLAMTGSGTTANAIVIGGQPAAIQPSQAQALSVIGSALVLRAGVIVHIGVLSSEGATTWKMFVENNTNAMGITPAFGLAATDVITFQATYEVA